MNRNVIIGVVLVALAAGGYYQFSVKPAREAAAAAQAAADEAAASAQKAVDDAAAAAKKAEEDAAAAAKKAADDAAAAAAAAVLDPAKFDAAKVNALIDASALDDATKTTLKAGVTAAASNPSAVAGAVQAVKTALGM